MVGVVYLDYYLPKKEQHVSEFLKSSIYKHARDEDFCDCYISQSRQEQICIENEKDEIQIFDIILEKFVNNGSVVLEDITHLIYTSPDNWVREGAYIPYYLTEKYNLKSASITGMVQECVTTLQALQVASALVDSGKAKNVMILSVCYGRRMEDRYTGSTVVGDGAGIMVVGANSPYNSIISAKSLSDGRYSYYKYNGLPPKIGGLEIAKKGADFIQKFLMDNNKAIEQVKLIVPQNINYSEYHMYTQYLGIQMNKIYSANISRGGHLAEVDTIRNLTDVYRQALVTQGDIILLYGSGTIGSGMDAVYNAVLLECT